MSQQLAEATEPSKEEQKKALISQLKQNYSNFLTIEEKIARVKKDVLAYIETLEAMKKVYKDFVQEKSELDTLASMSKPAQEAK